MADIECVLIIDDDEVSVTLGDDRPGTELIASIVDQLELPTVDEHDRYIYTLRDPVSRLQLVGDAETLAGAGIVAGARLKLHRTVQRIDADELAEDVAAEPVAAPLVSAPSGAEAAEEVPDVSAATEADDVPAADSEPEPTETGPAEAAVEERREPEMIEFTVLNQEREHEVSFLDDRPAREVIQAIVQEFDLPTVEDGDGILYTLEHPAEGELVLGEQETLHDAGVVSGSRITLLRVLQPNFVHFTIINEQQELPASLPKDKPSRELIDHLVQNLPTGDIGHEILYVLEHPAEGRLLITDEETLEEAGVEDGSRLRLLKLLYPIETTIGGKTRSASAEAEAASTEGQTESDTVAETTDGEQPSPLASFFSGLGFVFADWRPYLVILASATALAAFFLVPATDSGLFGLDSPMTLDLVLEIDEVADASGRDAHYLAYQWAVVPILAAFMFIIALTSIVDREGRGARMRAGATLGVVAAVMLASGWIGAGIVNESLGDALTRGTPLGFWEQGSYQATPGFAVMSVALLVAIPAGIGAGGARQDA